MFLMNTHNILERAEPNKHLWNAYSKKHTKFSIKYKFLAYPHQ